MAEKTIQRTPLRDLLFAEVAIREARVTAPAIEKARQIIEELERFGINRTLQAILVEYKLIDQTQEKDAQRGLSKVEVACPACRQPLALEEMSAEARLRCRRCKSLIQLELAEGGEADEAISTRLKGTVLENREREAAPKAQRSAAPGTDSRVPRKGDSRMGPLGGDAPPERRAQRKEESRAGPLPAPPAPERRPPRKDESRAGPLPAAPAPERRSPKKDESRAAARPAPPASENRAPRRDDSRVGSRASPLPTESKSPRKEEARAAGPAPDAPRRPREARTVNVRASIKRYLVVDVMSRGPNARLYRARSANGKGDHLVLKVLSPDRRPIGNAAAKLRKSLEVWSQLVPASPDPAHALEEEDGLVYVVRPLVAPPFVALSDVTMASHDEAVQTLWKIASHLRDIHAAGSFHGNLKPSNIFVSREGEKVLFVDPAHQHLLPTDPVERWRCLADSPRYRSPEEIAGQEIGPAADIYALGWIAYNILGGGQPFAGLPPPEILRRHREGPVPELPHELGEWGKFTGVLTAFDPAERPPDAGVVLEKIEALAAGKRLGLPSPKPRAAAAIPTELRQGRRSPLRLVVGPLLLIITLSWVGWWFLRGGPAREAFAAGDARGPFLYQRLAETAFDRAKADAGTAPAARAREVWERYLKSFSDSPFGAAARNEAANLPAPPPTEERR